MKQEEKEAAIQQQREIIEECQKKLKEKDYIGTEISMGVATVEQYAEEIALTEEWRAQLNSAKEELERLEAIEVEQENHVEL